MVNRRLVRGLLCLTAALAVLMAISAGAYAIDLKLVDAFPSIQGDGGWWLHSYEPETGTLVQLNWAANYSFKMPVAISAGQLPMAEKVGSYILTHPGMNGTADRWAVISFVAPAAGTYTFNVAFANGASSPGCTTKAFVYLDPAGAGWLTGSKLFEGDVSIGTAAMTGVQSVTLATGDRLRFAVSGMGNVSFDYTKITDQPLPSVPEPASLAVLASGLLGAVVIRRRK